MRKSYVRVAGMNEAEPSLAFPRKWMLRAEEDIAATPDIVMS